MTTTDRDARTPGGGRVAGLLVLVVPTLLVAALVGWAAVGLSGPGADAARDTVAPGTVTANGAGTDPTDRTGDAGERAGWDVFRRGDDGELVRWDGCRPIRWAHNPNGAPEGARAVLAEAVDRVADATGLTFVDVGDVATPLATDRSTLDAGDPSAWAPVLFGWAAPGQTDLPLTLQDRAVTVVVAAPGPDGDVLVTGQVLFNTAWPLEVSFGDRHVAWGATFLHELGHVVGLDHVDDEGELLHRSPGFGPAVLGPGDLAGLAAVGVAGGCRRGPPPSELRVAPPAFVSN